MGQKVVTMEMKYAAMFASVQAKRETVTAVCVRVQISRTSYYRYLARFKAEGLAGLQSRSRRPRSSPNLTPPAMVELIMQARRQLPEEGWDNGAVSIRNRLLRDGQMPPSWRTIHRVLVREGAVEPQPGKKPRSAYRRFEFPATDDCWQIDAFEYQLAIEVVVVVFELKDDCSRTQVANLAWPAEETAGAWACIARGIEDFGAPRMILADNSLAFTGKHHNLVVLVEKNLAKLGIPLITSRPSHPQTCGKIERSHQTLQHWLTARPRAASLVELQALLDEYQTAYNHRPHQGLDANQTPLERRIVAARPAPDEGPTPAPWLVRHCQARAAGYVSWTGHQIAIGRELAGKTLLVFARGDHVIIFYRHLVVRELDLDRARRYQPFGQPRRRDSNRQRLLQSLQPGPLTNPNPGNGGGGPPPDGQAPGLPATASPGGRRGSGSRAAAGRRTAIASATLEAEKRPHYAQRGAPATPPEVSPMS